MKQNSIIITHKKKLLESNKNLFLVSNAMHLFNAIEAQKYFKTENNILVLLFYGSGNQDENNILKYLHLFPYNTLVTFKPSPRKLYHKQNLKLIRIINQYEYKYVFLGFFSANLRRFVCNFNYEKLFLYDDGTYTIALHDELYCSQKDSILIKPYSEKPRKTKIMQIIFRIYDFYRRFYFRLHGYRSDFEKDIDLNFFTIFKLHQCQKEIIINHSFNNIKKIFLNKNTKINNLLETVLFLGQPLHKTFNTTYDKYLDYMLQIYNYFLQKKMKIIYVAHRADEKQIIQSLKNLHLENFQILELNIPIEVYLLENNIQIQYISSFFSSGIFTIKTLFQNSKAIFFKVPFDKNKRQDINIIYENAKKFDIDIIQLDT